MEENVNLIISNQEPLLINAKSNREQGCCSACGQCLKENCLFSVLIIAVATTQYGIYALLDPSASGLAFMGCFVFVWMVSCALLISNLRHKKDKAVQEVKTTNIRECNNTFVMIISIKQYASEDPQYKDEELEEEEEKLNLAADDYGKLYHLFSTTYGYTVYNGLNGNDINNPKFEWYPNNFEKQLDKGFEEFAKSGYDSLIVWIDSHGRDNYIITSDNKSRIRINIHRRFSQDYPHLRHIPRVFIFDASSTDLEYPEFRTDTIIVPELDDKYDHCDRNLFVIHASTPGYMAQNASNVGSYLIHSIHKGFNDAFVRSRYPPIEQLCREAFRRIAADGKPSPTMELNDSETVTFKPKNIYL